MPRFTADVSRKVAQKLTEARVATGLSTRSVASKLSDRFKVSHATLANYESGKTSPPLEVLSVLASVYERPLTWFLEGGHALTGIQYRNCKSKVRVQDKHRYEGQAKKWLEAYVKLEERLEKPLVRDRRLKGFKVSASDTGRKVAQKLRRTLGISPDQPIQSVVGVLEMFAIRVMEIPTDARIDGFAARFGNEHVVILNPPESANDRARMNAAHELGHVLYGDCEGDKECNAKALEERAYEFASYFMLPYEQLEQAMAGKSMIRLLEYKERFGIALAAMVLRADREELISKSTARYLWIQFRRRGWSVKEPGYVWKDRATRFEKMLESAFAGRKLRWREAAIVTGITKSELRQRIVDAMGVDFDMQEGGDDDQQILKMPR